MSCSAAVTWVRPFMLASLLGRAMPLYFRPGKGQIHLLQVASFILQENTEKGDRHLSAGC